MADEFGTLTYGEDAAGQGGTAGLSADVQSFTPGDIVVLFDIDTRPIGGEDVWHLVAGTVAGTFPVWKGNTYTPYPIMAEGFEWSGRGTLPKPTLTVGNVMRLLQGAVIQYNDLLGAKVTRWKTLSKYLDNGATPNPDVHFVPDIYIIDRKSQQTKVLIEFELAAILDQQGKMVPNRQIIRDSCPYRYRRWNGSSFVYDQTEMACPYTGPNMANAQDQGTTDPAQDICGKRMNSCQIRFGFYDLLPFGGFPAVSRTR